MHNTVYKLRLKSGNNVNNLLLSDKKIHQVDICFKKLSSRCSEKLSGIKIDSKLTFEEHVQGLKNQSKSQCSGKNFFFNEI